VQQRANFQLKGVHLLYIHVKLSRILSGR